MSIPALYCFRYYFLCPQNLSRSQIPSAHSLNTGCAYSSRVGPISLQQCPSKSDNQHFHNKSRISISLKATRTKRAGTHGPQIVKRRPSTRPLDLLSMLGCCHLAAQFEDDENGATGAGKSPSKSGQLVNKPSAKIHYGGSLPRVSPGDKNIGTEINRLPIPDLNKIAFLDIVPRQEHIG